LTTDESCFTMLPATTSESEEKKEGVRRRSKKHHPDADSSSPVVGEPNAAASEREAAAAMWRSRSSRDLGPMVEDWRGFDSAAAPLRAGLWSCLVSSGSGGESERKRGFSLSAVVGPAPLPGVLHEPQGGGLRAAARAMGACRGVVGTAPGGMCFVTTAERG
jgi:hypothetical protein